MANADTQPVLYWHIHHEVLLEPATNIEERKRYIMLYKPEHERATRLRLMQPVRGQLPGTVQAIAEACLAAYWLLQQKNAAVRAARQTYCADQDAIGEFAWSNPGGLMPQEYRDRLNAHHAAYRQAGRDRQDAENTFQAWSHQWIMTVGYHRAAIEALHAQECLNCPWDGKTIFPIT